MGDRNPLARQAPSAASRDAGAGRPRMHRECTAEAGIDASINARHRPKSGRMSPSLPQTGHPQPHPNTTPRTFPAPRPPHRPKVQWGPRTVAGGVTSVGNPTATSPTPRIGPRPGPQRGQRSPLATRAMPSHATHPTAPLGIGESAPCRPAELRRASTPRKGCPHASLKT